MEAAAQVLHFSLTRHKHQDATFGQLPVYLADLCTRMSSQLCMMHGTTAKLDLP